MTWFGLFGTLTLVAGLASAEGPARESSAAEPVRSQFSARAGGPPVLRNRERPDDVLVTLPGTPPPAEQPLRPIDTIRRDPPAQPDDDRPVLRRAVKPFYPPDFERDSALYCQHRIGQWSQPDAYNIFGDSLRERPAIDDDKTENGRIYAFSDPTGRYREIELDFAAETGVLRTVFVYPWTLTWKDCVRLWGAKVNSTAATDGRVFYSYMNRRLDVLVDSGGKVISFGLY